MKSIMEEGSSVIKAIEKGWAKAGSPKEFSVKILEEAQKNFIGMTVKPAKVAIIFDIEKEQKNIERHRNKPAQRTKNVQAQPVAHTVQKEKVSELREIAAKPQVKERIERTERTERHTERPERHAEQPQTNQPMQQIWSQDMIDSIKHWLKDFLSLTDHADANFSAHADKYYLKINFNKALHENTSKERQIFAALSLLLMQSLRKHLNRPLKGYKIILMRNEKPAQS